MWRSFLNRQRRVVVGVNRWRLTLVVISASFVTLGFVEHCIVFRCIVIGERIRTVVRNFIRVRSNSCCDFRLRFWKNIVGERDVLLKYTWPSWVFHANNLVVIDAFGNSHLIIDGSSDVAFGVGYRRDRLRSRFSDIMLIVGWRRWNCTPRLSVHSIIIIRNVALRCWLNCSSLISRRTRMIDRAISRRKCVRRVKDQFARDRIFTAVRCCCFNDLRARLAVDKTKKCCSKCWIYQRSMCLREFMANANAILTVSLNRCQCCWKLFVCLGKIVWKGIFRSRFSQSENELAKKKIIGWLFERGKSILIGKLFV